MEGVHIECLHQWILYQNSDECELCYQPYQYTVALSDELLMSVTVAMIFLVSIFLIITPKVDPSQTTTSTYILMGIRACVILAADVTFMPIVTPLQIVYWNSWFALVLVLARLVLFISRIESFFEGDPYTEEEVSIKEILVYFWLFFWKTNVPLQLFVSLFTRNPLGDDLVVLFATDIISVWNLFYVLALVKRVAEEYGILVVCSYICAFCSYIYYNSTYAFPGTQRLKQIYQQI